MNCLLVLRRLLLLLVFLLVGSFFVSGSAHAGITCNVTNGPSLSFGTFDPQTGNQDASTTINYTCSQTDIFAFPAHVTMCLSIGVGSGGQMNPRLMPNNTPPLQFRLYTDPSRTTIWGALGASYPPLQLSFDVPGSFFSIGTHSGSVPVYGRVPLGQTGINAGNYSNNIGDSFLSFDSNTRTSPLSCGTGHDGTFAVDVSANVQPTCKVTADDLIFGTVNDFLTHNYDSTSMIHVTCVTGTQYKVGLDNGQHANVNTRRMQGPGGYVSYELYQDSGRTVRWGNTPGTDTEPGSGSGTMQNLTVYGRVPPQSTPAAGNYSDTVTVTVTY
jgi:spore coat protein U-like protein